MTKDRIRDVIGQWLKCHDCENTTFEECDKCGEELPDGDFIEALEEVLNKYWNEMSNEDYIIPKSCKRCNSENISLRVIYESGVARGICNDCGESFSLAKTKNINKRTNSSLNSWAKQVKDHSHCCYVCGSKEDLEAHHIIPVSHARELTLSKTNGIVLCHKCHYLVHHSKGEERNE